MKTIRAADFAGWIFVLPLMLQFSDVTSAQPATGPCYVSGSRDYVLIHRGNNRSDGLFPPLVNRQGQQFPRLPYYYMEPGEFLFICSQQGRDIAVESPDGYAARYSGLTRDDFKNRWGIVVSSTQSVPAAMAARVKLEEEDRKWAVINNERAQQQARAEAEGRAKAAAAETKKQEARNAIIKQQREFISKHNATWVKLGELAVNPFIYEGKVVAFKSNFNSMLTRDTALFDPMGHPVVFSKVPAGQFTKQSTVVMAGRVEGKTEVRLPLVGAVQVPLLRFEGVHICPDSECSDFFPK